MNQAFLWAGACLKGPPAAQSQLALSTPTLGFQKGPRPTHGPFTGARLLGRVRPLS